MNNHDFFILNSITDPAGNVTSIGYEEVFSGTSEARRLTHVVDPEGNRLEYEYLDDTAELNYQSKIERETLKNGITYEVGWDFAPGENGDRIAIYDTTSNGSRGDLITSVETSSNGWDVVGIATPSKAYREGVIGGTIIRKDGEGHQWVYLMDKRGRPLSITPPADGSDSTNRVIVYTYDDDASTTGFSANGHTLYASGTYKTRSMQVGDADPTYYEYDPETTRKLSMVDPEGNRTNYEYNDANWPHKITKTEVVGSDDYWTFTYFNSNGDLLTSTRTSNATSPATTWTISNSYTYYADGIRLKKRVTTGIDGNTTTTNFDSKGMIESIVMDEGGVDGTNTFTHDILGRVISETRERDVLPDINIKYVYDDLTRITDRILNTNGLDLTTSYTYDGEGQVTSITDGRGVVTTFDYDNRERMVSETYDAGGLDLEMAYEYDLSNRMTKAIDPRGLETITSYFNFDLPKTVTDDEGYDTHFTWDGRGNLSLVKIERAPGTDEFYETEFEYDDVSRLTTVSVDPNGLDLTTEYEYDDNSGSSCGCSSTAGSPLVAKSIDPASKATYYGYDGLNRMIRMVAKVGTDNGKTADSDDILTTIDFDDSNRIVEVTNPESEIVEYTFDELGRTEEETVDETGADLQTTITYDAIGPARTITMPNGNVVTYSYDAAGRRTSAVDTVGTLATYTYDAGGNVLTVTDGESNVNSNGYDAVGRVTVAQDRNGNRTYFEYDANSNLTKITDRNGRVTDRVFDDRDRLIKVTEDSASLKRVTEYTYDGMDKLLTLKAYSGSNSTGTTQTTSYEYDGAGRLTKAIYPDNDAGSNGIVYFAYNPAGTLATRTDQKGVVTTYGYDDLHRLTSRSYDDSITPEEVFAYDKASRLTIASNGVAEVAFTYDDAGRLIEVETTPGTGTRITETIGFGCQHQGPFPPASTNGMESYVVEYDYDVDNRTRTLTYPGYTSEIVEYYDLRDRLEAIDKDGAMLLEGSTFDDANRLEEREWSNGMDIGYTYDANGWVQTIDAIKRFTTLESLTYKYDPMGNVTVRKVETDFMESFGELYEYDTLHRLTAFDRGHVKPGDTISPAIRSPYTEARVWNSLDMLGNWLSHTSYIESVATGETRTVNAVNEYTSQTIGSGSADTLTSDNNGNLLTDPNAFVPNTTPGQSYEYDGENRLIRIRRDADTGTLSLVAEYDYDALGRRFRTGHHRDAQGAIANLDSDTVHVYGGGSAVLAEFAADADVGEGRQRWFVHGPSFPDPLVMIDETDLGDLPACEQEPLYYIKDMLGSVTALVDSNGVVVERYHYDPYGRTIISGMAHYHDHDFNGIIDDDDEAHLEYCTTNGHSTDFECVWLHDRDGDGDVDSADVAVFDTFDYASGTCDQKYAPSDWRRDPHRYFTMSSGPTGEVDPDDIDDCLYEACTNGFSVYGVGVNGVGTNGLLCGSVKTAVCVHVFDGDGDGDVDDDDEDLIDSMSHDMYRRHPLLISESHFGNPFMWTGQRYDAEAKLYHFKYRSYNPALGRWLQRDPLGYVDGAGLYEVVRSGPTHYSDSLGLLLGSTKGAPPAGFDPWGPRQVLPPRRRHGENDEDYYRRLANERLREKGKQNERQGKIDAANAYYKELGKGIADALTSVIPFINDGRDFWGFINGVDPVLNEPLTWGDRLCYAAGFVAGSGRGIKKAKDAATNLPDSVWKNRHMPTQVPPGTRKLKDKKPSSITGEVYDREAYYDEYGRYKGQTHRTDHGRSGDHPNPHHHRSDPTDSGKAPGTHEVNPETGTKVFPGEHPDANS